MRSLALLLIIANLAYLAWATLIDVNDVPLSASSMSNLNDAPRLVLASERTAPASKVSAISTPTPALAAASTGSNAVLPSASTSCLSVGPFQDLPAAAQASAALTGAGYVSRQRLEQGEFWIGYWVSVQNSRTREDADRAIARLKEHGVNDAYILPGSDSGNTISLGVFKDQERAQRRRDEVQQLGLTAQISDRKRSGSVYWVDVDLPKPGQTLDPALLGAEPGKILRLEMRACPANAASDKG